MKTRIITSVVGLTLLAVVMAFFNTPVFEAAVALLAVIAVHEIYKAFDLGEPGRWIYGGLAVYTVLVMFSAQPVGKLLLVPVGFALVLYLAVCVVRFNQSLDVSRLGGTVAFSIMVWAAFFALVYIKARLPQQQYGSEAVYLIIMALAFAWGGDTFAYFTGRFFGKHKLAPVVSPHKTVEGAIGGIIGSGLVGVLCTVVARFLTAWVSVENGVVTSAGYYAGGLFGYLPVFLLGMGCSVLGILGDLFASAVKRQLGIKDYGTIFPGHGGILDRFDSVLFIAPVVAITVWLRTM